MFTDYSHVADNLILKVNGMRYTLRTRPPSSADRAPASGAGSVGSIPAGGTSKMGVFLGARPIVREPRATRQPAFTTRPERPTCE